MNVALSLGSNLGNRLEFLQQAINLINLRSGTITNISNFYESEPWGFNCENYFLNATVKLVTSLSPLDLLIELQKIEKLLGRKNKTKDSYESRTIDIDIIFYENVIIQTPQLTIPHPLMHKRKFVLVPLNEIAPNWMHPIFKLNVQQLLEICPDITNINIYKSKS